MLDPSPRARLRGAPRPFPHSSAPSVLGHQIPAPLTHPPTVLPAGRSRGWSVREGAVDTHGDQWPDCPEGWLGQSPAPSISPAEKLEQDGGPEGPSGGVTSKPSDPGGCQQLLSPFLFRAHSLAGVTAPCLTHQGQSPMSPHPHSLLLTSTGPCWSRGRASLQARAGAAVPRAGAGLASHPPARGTRQ